MFTKRLCQFHLVMEIIVNFILLNKKSACTYYNFAVLGKVFIHVCPMLMVRCSYIHVSEQSERQGFAFSSIFIEVPVFI